MGSGKHQFFLPKVSGWASGFFTYIRGSCYTSADVSGTIGCIRHVQYVCVILGHRVYPFQRLADSSSITDCGRDLHPKDKSFCLAVAIPRYSLSGVNMRRIVIFRLQDVDSTGITSWSFMDLTSATFSLGKNQMDYQLPVHKRRQSLCGHIRC